MQTPNNGAGMLGTIVSWRVPREVPLAALRDALRQAGLDESLAGDMSPHNALRRALHDMRAGRVIRKLRRDGDLVYFQFTREYLDSREIVYAKEAELWLHLPTGQVGCTVAQIADEARRLLADHQAKRLTVDLTRLVQRVYDAHRADLVPIREQGGAYFVPHHHAELVRQTRVLLRLIGGNLRTYDVRLGSADTAESVAESLTDYLTGLIGEFRESMAGVTADSRADVVARRAGRIAELRRKLDCYRGLLAGYAERIRAELDEAERAFLAAVTAPAGCAVPGTESSACEPPLFAPAV